MKPFLCAHCLRPFPACRQAIASMQTKSCVNNLSLGNRRKMNASMRRGMVHLAKVQPTPACTPMLEFAARVLVCVLATRPRFRRSRGPGRALDGLRCMCSGSSVTRLCCVAVGPCFPSLHGRTFGCRHTKVLGARGASKLVASGGKLLSPPPLMLCRAGAAGGAEKGQICHQAERRQRFHGRDGIRQSGQKEEDVERDAAGNRTCGRCRRGSAPGQLGFVAGCRSNSHFFPRATCKTWPQLNPSPTCDRG